MKAILAIILSLFSTPALAQYYIPQPVTAPTIYAPSPPVTYQQYGTTTYGSDGTVAQRYGNQTYITTPNAAQPQVVCSTYGTITTCQ